ncbi:MAG: hypothetical protein N2037_03160 [Acidimicrobiales bacterium]|nr:hypothetical protein [Acidimicrobiales bacterium]
MAERPEVDQKTLEEIKRLLESREFAPSAGVPATPGGDEVEVPTPLPNVPLPTRR